MARTNQSGFTLIEVLVALVIAALGLALLFAASGSGLENVATSDRYMRASSLAQSRLSWVSRTLHLKKGDTSGDEDDGFRWHVHISDPSAHAGVGPQSQPLVLYPVTVTESWQSGLTQKRVSLYSERLGPP